jgi:uroporphyrinogen decarboxylase
MKTMTPKERVLTALSHREPDRVPMDFLGTPETIAKLGEHFGIAPDDGAYDPLAGRESHLSLLEKLSCDLRSVWPKYVGPEPERFEDGSYRDIWGYIRAPTRYETGVYYEYTHHPLAEATTVEEVDAYPWPNPDWFDYSAISEQCKQFAQYAIVAGSMGNLDFINRSAALRGVEQVLIDIGLKEPVIYRIFDHLSDFFLEYNRRMLEAAQGRIDIFWHGDDYGTQRGASISPRTFRQVFQPRWKRHLEQDRKYGVKHVMLHSCGSTRELIPDLIATGFDVLETVQPEAAGMAPTELKSLFGDRLSFHGTVSVQQDLPFHTAEEVRHIVRERIRVLAPGGGFVLAPTHRIQADTPVENILAVYETGLEHGHYT